MSSILILAEIGDTHSYAVAEALSRRGAKVTLWHTSDFPSRAFETIAIDDEGTSIRVTGPGLHLTEREHFDTVWNRRPAYSLDPQQLHPADRDFAWLECATFRRSLLALFSPEAFWVNSPDCSQKASYKPFQHQAAASVGFVTPATIYSNDPSIIRSFVSDRKSSVIYKPYRPAVWRDSETEHSTFTSIVTVRDLEAGSSLWLVPGIYQELVPKEYELRLTVCGNHVFGAKILSQQTPDGSIDWRKAYGDLQFEPANVPQPLADRCCLLLDRLGLVVGCIDLIVRPDGEVVFLEVNQMGQFLFLEYYSGVPALDIFCDFLMHGGPHFRYKRTAPLIWYREVLDLVSEQALHHSTRHAALQDRAIIEST